LRKIRKSSLKRRELRSSPFGFAELFRSVCRNVSGKLLSHAFAALTALCGVPPHKLLASFSFRGGKNLSVSPENWNFYKNSIFLSAFSEMMQP